MVILINRHIGLLNGSHSNFLENNKGIIKMKRSKKAFTMMELVFVIVIIGILSAVAIPKFTQTSILAHDAKATSVLTSVMSAIATERQKRILKGDTAPIISLGSGDFAFSKFSADSAGTTNDIVSHPVSNCGSDETGCWTRSGTSYKYTFVDSGTADFKLANNKLECDNDAADCARLLK